MQVTLAVVKRQTLREYHILRKKKCNCKSHYGTYGEQLLSTTVSNMEDLKHVMIDTYSVLSMEDLDSGQMQKEKSLVRNYLDAEWEKYNYIYYTFSQTPKSGEKCWFCRGSYS